MAKTPSDGCDKGGAPPRFLLVREVAAALGVSTRTVRDRIADGSIPAARIGDGRTLHVPETFLTELAKTANRDRKRSAA